MLVKSKLYKFVVILICAISVLSCADSGTTEKVDYTFEAAINTEQGHENFDKINFEPHKNLDLGFHKGNVWVKLEINNGNDFESYIVMTNDLIHRNYRFYKLDTLSHTISPLIKVTDLNKQDHRTFNYPKPNFKIELKPNEHATFFMTTVSDGRILQATPQLLSLEEYRVKMSQSTIFNIVFFVTIGMIFLINIFLWSILKNKIYYYYGFYILSSCLFYLHVEGQLYGLGLTHNTVDHLMFLSIRIWIFSAILFTSKFLEIHTTNPKFNKIVKGMLILILGGGTLYQFIFYNSSISQLHKLENLFGFIWVVTALLIIILSFKKRKVLARYYLLAFSFLLFFILLGLIDSHFTLLPGDPFSYFRIGTIIEFCGFTYFIALIIKHNINKAAELENELNLNKKELSDAFKQLESNLGSPKTTLEKTDLLSIFKLLENSLSKEKDWPEFKAKFKELSPNFLVNLKQAHPNLSKSEIRLLILIRIDFTQKETASILQIAPDSVKKAKQRVRKKLNLSSDLKLTTYLSQYN